VVLNDSKRDTHLPVRGLHAWRWTNHKVCDARPARHHTYGYLRDWL